MGIRKNCKDCKRIYNKNYSQTKREKLNDYQKNRKETNPQFHLAMNSRIRVNHALKSQNVNKNNKTFQMNGCSQSFLKDWIIFQLYGDMKLENYGKIWCLDHCIPVSSFNLLDEDERRKCFIWSNLRRMYIRDNIIKSNKIDHRLYLQEIKANYFKKLNE